MSGKMWKDTQFPSKYREGRIFRNSNVKRQKRRFFYAADNKAEALRNTIERIVNVFGSLEHCMTCSWCTASITVHKSPPIDQHTIWRLVIDYKGLNDAKIPDANTPPYMEGEESNTAEKKVFSILDLRHAFHKMPPHRDDPPLWLW